jgi:hypothetical protein
LGLPGMLISRFFETCDADCNRYAAVTIMFFCRPEEGVSRDSVA